MPKYNISLTDDRRYPYIVVTNEKDPRILYTRDIKKNKGKVYGPYPNVTAARGVVNLLNRIYPLRKCNTFLKKPCLYYHIGECLGYCTKDIDLDKVNSMKNDIIKFLNGDNSIVTNKLKEKMEFESNKLNFEKAKEYKELIDYVNITLTKQKVELKDKTEEYKYSWHSFYFRQK